MRVGLYGALKAAMGAALGSNKNERSMRNMIQRSVCLQGAWTKPLHVLSAKCTCNVGRGMVGSEEDRLQEKPMKGRDQSRTSEAGSYIFLRSVGERFTAYLNSCTIRSAWLRSQTVLLKKKNVLEDWGNYCPIALLSQLYKLFAECF